LDDTLHPPRVVVLRGPAEEVATWRLALTPRQSGRDILLALPNGLSLPEALARPESAQASAWVCWKAVCQAPISDIHALKLALNT